MKKLIVSYDTYSWVKYCSATIMRDPDNFEVLVIRSQNEDPILGHEDLCEAARYEQRKYDLFKIGKELGIRKVYNLRYPDLTIHTTDLRYADVNVQKLIAELQLRIIFGAVCKVYYQHTKLLDLIFEQMNKKMTHLEIYSYGGGGVLKERIELTTKERVKKISLCDLIVGITKTENNYFPSLVERFQEIKRRKENGDEVMTIGNKY